MTATELWRENEEEKLFSSFIYEFPVKRLHFRISQFVIVGAKIIQKLRRKRKKKSLLPGFQGEEETQRKIEEKLVLNYLTSFRSTLAHNWVRITSGFAARWFQGLLWMQTCGILSGEENTCSANAVDDSDANVSMRHLENVICQFHTMQSIPFWCEMRGSYTAAEQRVLNDYPKWDYLCWFDIPD